MKFLLISPKNRTVYNFRGDLIQAIQNKGYEVIVTGPDEDGLPYIKALGVKFYTVPLKKNGLNILEDIQYIRRLKKVITKEKVDVTLGYTIKPAIYGAIAARLAGVQNINSMVTGAGYVFAAKTIKAGLLKMLAVLLYKIGFKCADTVIFQNTDDLNEFKGLRLVHENKAKLVNGSGVNLDKYPKTNLPEQLTFFMLSRVLYSKGIREYLEAASIIKRKYPQIRFMLLGAVENMPDAMTEEALKVYMDNKTIEFFGETKDVTPYFSRCSVYVLPSYREGTPRTVLEAMAMGRPVLTTDAPGCRETVIDGRNGFLVPVRDSVKLAEKMEWFIHNPERISKMGEASYELCKNKYDVRIVNGDMMNFMRI